jgi:hypothetical protein
VKKKKDEKKRRGPTGPRGRRSERSTKRDSAERGRMKRSPAMTRMMMRRGRMTGSMPSPRRMMS